MIIRLRLGLLTAFFLTTGLVVLAQTSDKTLEFSLRAGEDRPVLFGAVVRKKRSWKVYSIGLTLHSTDPAAESCLITLSGQGRPKKKRVELSRGEAKSYDLVPDHPDVLVEISRATEHFCEGRLTLDSESAEDWRGLSAATADYLVSTGPGSTAVASHAEGVTAPRLVHQTTPRYTRTARLARVEGATRIQLVINEEGKVDPSQIYILKNLGYGLDEAAIEEILNDWQFLPGSQKGQKVPIRVFVDISFQLH